MDKNKAIEFYKQRPHSDVSMHFFYDKNAVAVSFNSLQEYEKGIYNVVNDNYNSREENIASFKAQLESMNHKINNLGTYNVFNPSCLSDSERKVWIMNVIFLVKIGAIPDDEDFGILIFLNDDLTRATISLH